MSLILVSNFAHVNIIRSSSNPTKISFVFGLNITMFTVVRIYILFKHSRILSLLPTDLTTYDTVKQAILRNTRLEDNALTHALSRCVIGYLHSYHIYCISTWFSITHCIVNSQYSACSGLVSASLGTPADVVKTRMMNQKYVDGRCAYIKGVYKQLHLFTVTTYTLDTSMMSSFTRPRLLCSKISLLFFQKFSKLYLMYIIL